MSLPKSKSLIRLKTAGSFLEEWSERKLPTYIEEYGGERAGVPKGEDIPFPTHKVRAAVALLRYGAQKHETLAAIGSHVGVTSSLLRVWRTEERFLTLYRQAVWACADDYIHLLGVSWDNHRLAPYQEFQECFGVALQQAILRRLLVDVIRMAPEWEPLDMSPRWRSEFTLIGRAPANVPHFTSDEIRMMTLNARLLLAYGQIGQEGRKSSLLQWARSLLLRTWTMSYLVNTDLRAAVKGNDQNKALELIDFLVSGRSPLDDQREFQRLVTSSRTGRKSR